MPKQSSHKGFDADFDFFWKEMLDLTELATSFFLPELHQEVDWSLEYKSLEQELRGPFSGRRSRPKRTDKLFKLKLKDGSDRFVLFHIEAEAYPNSSFPQRIFEYYAYLSVKFGFTPIAVLAIFVGDKSPVPFNHFTTAQFGTRLDLRFTTCSIGEWTEKDLLSSSNPFALVVLANLYVIQSKGNSALRMELKRRLVTHLLSRNIPLEKFRTILNFALLFVRLKEEDEASFFTFIEEQFSQKNNSKMSGSSKVQVKDYAKIIMDSLSKKYYGETAEEAQRKSVEAQRKSVEAQQKLEDANRTFIITLHKDAGFSPEKIAATMNIDVNFVKKVLDTL